MTQIQKRIDLLQKWKRENTEGFKYINVSANGKFFECEACINMNGERTYRVKIKFILIISL